ncbi:DUF4328 domain-containing protein [Pseudonocardia sp. DLS-67]
MRRLATTVAALSATAALSMGIVTLAGWHLIAPAVAPVERTGCTSGEVPLADAAAATMGVAFLTCVLATLGAACASLVWVWRARANAGALGSAPQRLSRFWAVGCWLVPIANVVLPRRVLVDIWAASCTDRAEYRPWVRLIRAWWAAQWATLVLVVLLPHVTDGVGAGLLISLLTVVGHGTAALFAAIVLKISNCQTVPRRPLGVPSVP